MNLLEIQAKTVVVIMEETIEGMEKIKKALDVAEINPVTEEEKEAAKYLTMVFYPFIVEVLEKVKGKENA